jgi:hypothetical protein
MGTNSCCDPGVAYFARALGKSLFAGEHLLGSVSLVLSKHTCCQAFPCVFFSVHARAGGCWIPYSPLYSCFISLHKAGRRPLCQSSSCMLLIPSNKFEASSSAESECKSENMISPTPVPSFSLACCYCQDQAEGNRRHRSPGETEIRIFAGLGCNAELRRGRSRC